MKTSSFLIEIDPHTKVKTSVIQRLKSHGLKPCLLGHDDRFETYGLQCAREQEDIVTQIIEQGLEVVTYTCASLN